MDFPDRSLDRLSTLLRLLFVIPIGVVLSAAGGYHTTWFGHTGWQLAIGGVLGAGFFAPMLMIIFRQKYPRWWFDFSVMFMKFEARVIAYALLLRDEYPSTDEEQAVHLEADYPNVKRDLNRWLPPVKWLLALPHWLILAFLCSAAVVAVGVAWFFILFTGRYPRRLHKFVTGVMRWTYRVMAYAVLLNTDRYPPFKLR